MNKEPAGIIIWDDIEEQKYLGTVEPFKDGVQLFNSKRKWWLYYGVRKDGSQHITGDFKSKKEAMAWYNKGGR